MVPLDSPRRELSNEYNQAMVWCWFDRAGDGPQIIGKADVADSNRFIHRFKLPINRFKSLINRSISKYADVSPTWASSEAVTPHNENRNYPIATWKHAETSKCGND